MATYRSLDPALGMWLGVDPKAEALYGLSPYQAMGNNPITQVDPEGDIFFAIPQIGYSNSGGFSFGLEVGVGIPGVLSASITGGFSTKNGAYWSGQGYAAVLYGGYGSSGFFAGIGYSYAGFSVGYDFGSGTASLGFGGGFGNGYAGSIGLSYGKGGLGFNAGVSSKYMWGTLNPGNTAEPGGGDLQQGSGNIVGSTGLYEDETLAYNVMWEQSVSNKVVTSAWLVDEGVLISPIEYGSEKNTYNSSSNRYYSISFRGKGMYVHSDAKSYRVIGQIHTHPLSDHPLSDFNNTGRKYSNDQAISNWIGYGSVYAIAQNNVYRGYHSKGSWYSHSFGLRVDLLSGSLKLIR